MKITTAFRQVLVACFFIAIIAMTASSCKSSQYGCPNKITQEEPQKEVDV